MPPTTSPASWSELGLPPEDRDCDGEPDGAGWPKRLTWRSSDPSVGRVSLVDHPARIVRVITGWGRSRSVISFEAEGPGGERVEGWVRESETIRDGVATVRRGSAATAYVLVRSSSRPPAVTLLEGNVPLVDGAWFDRPCTLNARVEGGTGPLTVAATVDDSPYQLGSSWDPGRGAPAAGRGDGRDGCRCVG